MVEILQLLIMSCLMGGGARYDIKRQIICQKAMVECFENNITENRFQPHKVVIMCIKKRK